METNTYLFNLSFFHIVIKTVIKDPLAFLHTFHSDNQTKSISSKKVFVSLYCQKPSKSINNFLIKYQRIQHNNPLIKSNNNNNIMVKSSLKVLFFLTSFYIYTLHNNILKTKMYWRRM